jgi:AmmeMemoRadiSam system protein B
MQPNLRPQLRSHLNRIADVEDPRFGLVVDGLRQCAAPLRLPRQQWQWLDWFDGGHTFRDMQLQAQGNGSGDLLPLGMFLDLARRLDDALLLEGPRWQQRLEAPIREPACVGCYEGEPRLLCMQLEELFTRRGGPGLPRRSPPEGEGKGRLRAALLPHIDYARGGSSYAWGFKEVFEQTDASLFVIIGTSHYSTERFTMTRKRFKTPLGILPTDEDFIDRIVKHYGDGLFDDEILAHLPEHSIELEVVFLQWYYARRRPIRIVPLVVGSFHDATLSRKEPAAFDDISRMVLALQRAEAEIGEPICYLISGDLAHIGPKFMPGRGPVTDEELDDSLRQDQALLERLELVDLAGFCKIVADEQDARAICGYPPAFTVLRAAQPACGNQLCYDRYVHSRRLESVSFASMAFYR